MNARRKGHDYERQVRRELAKYFPEVMTSRAADPEADCRGVDLVNTPGYAFQCKAVENSVNYPKILREMITNSKKVILHKRDRKQYAIMEVNTFFELLNNNKHERD